MTAPPPPPLPRFPRKRVVTVVLVVMTVLGVALLGTGAWLARRPPSFGWYAYAPLSDTYFSPGDVYSPVLAALLAAAGALLLGGVGGFLVGRRARRSPPATPE
ncbi:hypothetical protein [Cellulosimicrobium cellulans]|uniref:hypothetical protein n=1 Tax=Cellulosimicrobium cellulans TaxID=1710 RepID=UPI001112E911|nr:hypothetical protein [Cellulosimicrobium cellulans]